MLSGVLTSLHTQLARYTSICLADIHTRAYTHMVVCWGRAGASVLEFSGVLRHPALYQSFSRSRQSYAFYFRSATEGSSASHVGFLYFSSSAMETPSEFPVLLAQGSPRRCFGSCHITDALAYVDIHSLGRSRKKKMRAGRDFRN